MLIKIERFSPHQKPQVIKLHNMLFKNFRNSVFVSETNTFVATDNDLVVGYLNYHADSQDNCDEWFINFLGTNPDYRRLGIAKSILETIVQEAEVHKINTISLFVREGNTNARNLYEKFGFTGQKNEYKYPDGEKSVYYEYNVNKNEEKRKAKK